MVDLVVEVSEPFKIFHDIDGSALEDGYIYIGHSGFNPITNPIAVYSDYALSLPLTQPIRTTGGYPVQAGTPIQIFVALGFYSISVYNKKGTLIYTDLQVEYPNAFSGVNFPFLQAAADSDLSGMDSFSTVAFRDGWSPSSEGPRGGGLYYRDGSNGTPSTFYTDNSGIFDTNGDGFSLSKDQRITPWMFGAYMDGSTLDSVYLGYADDFCADGELIFPQGALPTVDQQVVISCDWTGAGRDSIVIKATGLAANYQAGGTETTPTMIRWGNGAGGKTKRIKGITFDLNRIMDLSWIAESSIGSGFVGGNSHSIFESCRVINGNDNGDHASTLGYAIHFENTGGVLNGILVGATFINLLMEEMPRCCHLGTTTDDITFINPRFLNTGTVYKSSRWPIYLAADANVHFQGYFFNFTQYDTVNWTVDRVSWIFCGAFGPHVFTSGFVEDISLALATPNSNNFLYIWAFGSNTQCLDIIDGLTVNWGSAALLALCSITEASASSQFTRDLSVKNITCRTTSVNNVVPPLLFEIFQPTANAGLPKYKIQFDGVDVFPKLYDWRTGTTPVGVRSSTLIGTYRGKRYNSITRTNAPGTTDDFPQDFPTIWVPSSDFRASTSFPGATEADYGSNLYRCWALDATTREDITANLGINTNRCEKYLAKIYWTNLGAGVGDVRFQLTILIAGQADALAVNGTGWIEVVTALADDTLNISQDAQAFEFVWPRGELGAIKLARLASDGTDTLPNDAGVIGVLLEPVFS